MRIEPPPVDGFRYCSECNAPGAIAIRLENPRVVQNGMVSFCRSCWIQLRSLSGQSQRPLTQRQAEMYSFIQTRIALQQYAPSFEEIADKFGFSSLATVHEHLTNLERKGWIRREAKEARSIVCLVEESVAA